jgi:hypothetical protein
MGAAAEEEAAAAAVKRVAASGGGRGGGDRDGGGRRGKRGGEWIVRCVDSGWVSGGGQSVWLSLASPHSLSYCSWTAQIHNVGRDVAVHTFHPFNTAVARSSSLFISSSTAVHLDFPSSAACFNSTPARCCDALYVLPRSLPPLSPLLLFFLLPSLPLRLPHLSSSIPLASPTNFLFACLSDSITSCSCFLACRAPAAALSAQSASPLPAASHDRAAV